MVGDIYVATNIVYTHLTMAERTTTVSTLATPETSTPSWNIDPAHTVAEFKVKHMMISNLKGQFAEVTGWLTVDESDLKNSRVEALIEASSIETRDAQRDAHLKGADFFDVEKFPTLSFKSSRITPLRDGELAVEGDVTIRGVTRKLVFTVERPTPPAKDPWGGTRVAVSATHKDQPQRLRPYLERGARDRWHSGWGRGDHLAMFSSQRPK